MKHVSLFTGMGATDIAAEALGFKTVATAEIDPWNRALLEVRFPDAWHFKDVRQVRREHFGPNGVDAGIPGPLLVSGGFPCQDLSVAGNALGLEGDRSGLWREFARVIEELEPEYVLIENVAVLRSRGLNAILWDLNRLGYEARWDCIPAAAVGAPHMRDRIWITAVRIGTTINIDGFRPDDLIPRGHVRTMTKGVHKLSRAGWMGLSGLVYEAKTVATQADARKAAEAGGSPLLPTPTKQDAANNGGPAQFRRNSLPLNAYVKLYPTPTRRDALGGPGTSPKRTGGKNLRTVAQEQFGDYKLSPRWVEWLMGLPKDWTNPEVPNSAIEPFGGWAQETLPRVDDGQPHRRKRVAALGNGLVPQCASVALSTLPIGGSNVR